MHKYVRGRSGLIFGAKAKVRRGTPSGPWRIRVSTCCASPFWPALLTNIGDIRSESVHDINKIRARRTGTDKAATPRRCTYFAGCVLFIPGGIRACDFFLHSVFEIFRISGTGSTEHDRTNLFSLFQPYYRLFPKKKKLCVYTFRN